MRPIFSEDTISSNATLLKGMQYVVLAGVILFFARDILIPISFALLISFVLYPLCIWFEKKGFGKMSAIMFSMTLLFLAGLLVAALLIYQLVGFLQEWPQIYDKLAVTIRELSNRLEFAGLSKDDQGKFFSKLTDESSGSLLTLAKDTISASAFSLVLLILIPVYAVLILYYRAYWMKILVRLFPSERKEALVEMITLTIKAYYNFIKGMAIVYVIVGSLNSVGLLLLGVPHAILFGFIASILTFIPYVGITIGSLLPMTMAWITYDSIWYPVGIVGIFTFVQYMEANVIFPVAVSNRLNINMLSMLVAIFAGGVLWGMAGMILFVPFVGIAKLVADHNPKWRTVSLILGTDNINNA
jgi:predicted PurR-regulated permease PerM